MFKGKTLLITGGTGSFGNAVLRHFLHSDVAEIRILSRDEKKQDDMRHLYDDTKLKFYIGDVRDPVAVTNAVRGVNYIFHAAALKQVPSCEFHPIEAAKTNVMGTENVLETAVTQGVERVICLSTDKAVYPINAMGMSKALMEKVMVAKSRMTRENGTIICGTRYGNVMASRGSVIPLFVSQMLAGQPITVTDPNMTRFMMSLDDAVELVIYAFSHGRAGDIFVQKAPATTMGTLADAIRIAFDRSDHSVRTIGARHGEKLYESLLTREEMVNAEDLGQYFRIPADTRDLNYKKYFDFGEVINQTYEYHSHNTTQLDLNETVALLNKLTYINSVRAGSSEPVFA